MVVRQMAMLTLSFSWEALKINWICVTACLTHEDS